MDVLLAIEEARIKLQEIEAGIAGIRMNKDNFDLMIEGIPKYPADDKNKPSFPTGSIGLLYGIAVYINNWLPEDIIILEDQNHNVIKIIQLVKAKE